MDDGMFPLFARFECHNPLRRPDWRWGRAQLLHTQGRRLNARLDDEYTCAAVHYFRAISKGSSASWAQPPHRLAPVWQAHDLRQTAGTARLLAEAYALAGLGIGETAARHSGGAGVPKENASEDGVLEAQVIA